MSYGNTSNLTLTLVKIKTIPKISVFSFFFLNQNYVPLGSIMNVSVSVTNHVTPCKIHVIKKQTFNCSSDLIQNKVNQSLNQSSV